MLISLKNLFEKDQNREEKTIPWDMDVFDTGMGSYSVTEASAVKAELFHAGKRRLQIRIEASCVLTVPCDRCLTDVKIPFAIDVSREIDGKAKTNQDDFDDTQYIVDESLDLDKMIRDELLLAWPAKILCKEDCKGLCSVCGQNLNVSDCGCDREVKDPRMAAIQDIFKHAQQ